MTNTNREFTQGEKIHCKSWQDLRTTALCLSSKGYGVAVIGFSDMSDDILTVTEVPESGRMRKDEFPIVDKLVKDSINDVLDKIRDEICDIDDETVLNPDSFYERKVYVRFSKVIDIIDKYKTESEAAE